MCTVRGFGSTGAQKGARPPIGVRRLAGAPGPDHARVGKNAVVGTAAAATCTPAAGKDCLPKLTYVDIDGRAYTPEAMAGKIVVINFWATWCGPCKKEIPAFSKVAEKYKDKVVMLGLLASDNPDAGTLLNFMSDFETVSYTHLTLPTSDLV